MASKQGFRRTSKSTAYTLSLHNPCKYSITFEQKWQVFQEIMDDLPFQECRICPILPENDPKMAALTFSQNTFWALPGSGDLKMRRIPKVGQRKCSESAQKACIFSCFSEDNNLTGRVISC